MGGMSWGREGPPSLECRVWIMGRESPRTQVSDDMATSECRIIALAMHERLRSRQSPLDHHRQTGLPWQDYSFPHGGEGKRHSRRICCRPANEIGEVYIWHRLNEWVIQYGSRDLLAKPHMSLSCCIFFYKPKASLISYFGLTNPFSFLSWWFV